MLCHGGQNWDFTFTPNVFDFYVKSRGFSFQNLTSVEEVVGRNK